MLDRVLETVPPDWHSIPAAAMAEPKVAQLEDFVARERAGHDVCPNDSTRATGRS
jgi:hypothetical protein